jgi:hypothetical protein
MGVWIRRAVIWLIPLAAAAIARRLRRSGWAERGRRR